MKVPRLLKFIFLAVSALTYATLIPLQAGAVSSGNFSLQVSPSPLVTTIKPGESKDLVLKIRNASTDSEELKIEPRTFRLDSVTGRVHLGETAPIGMENWMTFSEPIFTIKPGAWYTQHIHITLPPQAGFSYSFALVISRTSLPKSAGATQLLNGSVAVFTLINVDRPGATRGLALTSLTTSHRVYEYLPATFNIKLKNTGNTIVQPFGSLFISRGGDTSNNPVASLPVNGNQSYLLPDTERTLTATWSDGFPIYKTDTTNTGKQRASIFWNWDNISHVKFGRYTAKVVAVYNDGSRDIPVEKDVTFWVIPWKAMLLVGAICIGIIVAIGLFVKRHTAKAVQRAIAKNNKSSR